MKLLIRPQYKIPFAYSKYKQGLLPFFVLWPQQVFVFLCNFVQSLVVRIVKEKILPLLLLVVFVLFGQHVTSHDLLNIWDVTLFAPTLILTVLVSYDTATKRKSKERITYSRDLDDEEE